MCGCAIVRNRGEETDRQRDKEKQAGRQTDREREKQIDRQEEGEGTGRTRDGGSVNGVKKSYWREVADNAECVLRY